MNQFKGSVFESSGVCPVCQQDVTFVAFDSWFRDYFICPLCHSVPRERALMAALDIYAPNWHELTLHESSPSSNGASRALSEKCKDYISSQYFPGTPSGCYYEGVRCENLENLSFSDCSIDIHVSQDVLEHVNRPSLAFREIARTLKPGGMHIFTVPLVQKANPSQARIRWSEDQIIHVKKPEYHSSPVGDGKSLVTHDWGYDICEYIYQACGLFTQILFIDDISRGIRAELVEVLVTMKPVAR